MSRLSFAEALAEDDKKRQQQTQTTTPAQQQVVAGQIGGGSTADTSQATTTQPQPQQTTTVPTQQVDVPEFTEDEINAAVNEENSVKGTGYIARTDPRIQHDTNHPKTRNLSDEDLQKVRDFYGETEGEGEEDDTDTMTDPFEDSDNSTYMGYGNYGYQADDVQSLDDVVNTLEPYHVPNSEELKKEQKRQRRDMLIRSLGDGISAIAGLTTAINGGPNIVNPDASLAKSGMELEDKLREQRRKDYTAYVNAATRRNQANAAQLRARSAAETSRSKVHMQWYKTKAAVEAAERKLDIQASEVERKRAHDKAMEEIARSKAEVEAAYKQGLLTLKERELAIKQLNAQEKKLKGRSGGGRSSGGGKGSGAKWSGQYDENGNIIPEKTKYSGTTPPPQQVPGRGQKPAAGGSGSGGGKPASGNGGGKYENTKKLGL